MAEKKILVVDYDANSLEELSNLVAGKNTQVTKATDGQKAYDKYQADKPDLIILEAMLPKIHGFDLTQKIYKETKGGIPIVIVTGLYKGAQYRNEAIRSFGAAAYFEKPYDKEKLLETINQLLHDEVDIEDELPGPEAVMKIVRQMEKKG
ncbi:MAG: response regulator [Candidatus Aminicenantes bacterium]|nr:response regulator [Candidatus Aminicenantes bacterium]